MAAASPPRARAAARRRRHSGAAESARHVRSRPIWPADRSRRPWPVASAPSARRPPRRRRPCGAGAGLPRSICAVPTGPAARAIRRNCPRPPRRATPVRPAPPRPRAQHPDARDQFVEERRAMIPDEVGDRLSARPRRRRLVGRQRAPVRRAAPLEQRDRRRAHRARTARGAIRSGSAARPEARPGDAAGEAFIVQPGRFVVGRPGRPGSRPPTRPPALRNPRAACTVAASASGPSRCSSAVTCCQENRKRRKSRAATGSISARRRLTV